MPELFLEIGCEEIPAAFARRALSDLGRLVGEALEKARVGAAAIETAGTPRRLVLVARDVPEKQADEAKEVLGPPTRAAFDAQGNPTKAAVGFAARNNVEVADLRRVETPKGEYLAARVEEIGVATATLLSDLLPQILDKLPFKKSMRWSDVPQRFARPVHWIVALFGGAVIPFRFAEIESGSRSRGHRFLAPDSFEVAGFDDYVRKCGGADVVIDPVARRDAIAEALSRIGAEHGGSPVEDPDLLDEVSFLVEKPFALSVRFPERYLVIPEAVLISVLQKHQRCFSYRSPDGNLLPVFAFVAGTQVRDPALVAEGGLKVAKARFDDALFYLREDQKKSLSDRVESLQGIVFLRGLGTIREKVERIAALARSLAEALAPGVAAEAELAARLCKADLTTGVVKEFPELQGYIGREYARGEGLDGAVADAIYEHYRPRGASDGPPDTDLGAMVSLADKLDSLAGCFRIGQEPTGTADPLALRRQSLGILSTILGRGYHLSLSDWLSRALAAYDGQVKQPAEPAHERLLGFFEGRMRAMWTSDYPVDAVDSVLAAGFDDPLDTFARVEAVVAFEKRDDFEPVALTFKRVSKILKDAPPDAVDAARFEHEEEGALHEATKRVAAKVRAQMEAHDFAGALEALTGLSSFVNAFFDKVFVMHEDPAIRTNRLALLRDVAKLSAGLLDFGRLQA